MPTDIPQDICDTLTNDRAVAELPDMVTQYWLAAKELRGQPVSAEQMARLAAMPSTRHLGQVVPLHAKPRAASTFAEIIETALARTSIRTREIIQRSSAPMTSCGYSPTDGDAA